MKFLVKQFDWRGFWLKQQQQFPPKMEAGMNIGNSSQHRQTAVQLTNHISFANPNTYYN